VGSRRGRTAAPPSPLSSSLSLALGFWTWGVGSNGGGGGRARGRKERGGVLNGWGFPAICGGASRRF
jgi:hypothetical protein